MGYAAKLGSSGGSNLAQILYPNPLKVNFNISRGTGMNTPSGNSHYTSLDIPNKLAGFTKCIISVSIPNGGQITGQVLGTSISYTSGGNRTITNNNFTDDRFFNVNHKFTSNNSTSVNASYSFYAK